MNKSNIQYTSIKSVLYEVSQFLPEEYYNEELITEWIHKGLRKSGIQANHEQVVALLPLTDHKAHLPSSARFVVQMTVLVQGDTDSNTALLQQLRDITGLDDLDHMAFPDNLNEAALALVLQSNFWKPMRASNHSFLKSYTSGQMDEPTDNSSSASVYEYTIDPTLCLTTNIKDGFILVSYLRYAQDKNGDTLLPDSEILKEALTHYCMYRYWMTRRIYKEEGSAQERDWHLTRYSTLMARAVGDLNMPSEDQLDNMLQRRVNMLPDATHRATYYQHMPYRNETKNL